MRRTVRDPEVAVACGWWWLVGVLVGVVFGLCILLSLNKSWQVWALENGHAHYDSKTGAFVLEAQP